MSTWINDLKRDNPALADDYLIVGNQPDWAIKNMVKALSWCELLNSPEEAARLAAAKRILKRRK
jgi:hypothetical protein